jgi:hypothetical protein
MEGYESGFSRGCEALADQLPQRSYTDLKDFPVNKCMAKNLDFKGIDMAKDVTAFYRRYPENRDLFIQEILEELAKGRSIEEIHNHPPYPPLRLKNGVPGE